MAALPYSFQWLNSRRNPATAVRVAVVPPQRFHSKASLSASAVCRVCS